MLGGGKLVPAPTPRSLLVLVQAARCRTGYPLRSPFYRLRRRGDPSLFSLLLPYLLSPREAPPEETRWVCLFSLILLDPPSLLSSLSLLDDPPPLPTAVPLRRPYSLASDTAWRDGPWCVLSRLLVFCPEGFFFGEAGLVAQVSRNYLSSISYNLLLRSLLPDFCFISCCSVSIVPPISAPVLALGLFWRAVGWLSCSFTPSPLPGHPLTALPLCVSSCILRHVVSTSQSSCATSSRILAVCPWPQPRRVCCLGD